MGVLEQLENFCKEQVSITGPPLWGVLGVPLHTHTKLDSWIGSRMEKKVELKPTCPLKASSNAGCLVEAPIATKQMAETRNHVL